MAGSFSRPPGLSFFDPLTPLLCHRCVFPADLALLRHRGLFFKDGLRKRSRLLRRLVGIRGWTWGWTWEVRAETSPLSLVPGLLSGLYWGEKGGFEFSLTVCPPHFPNTQHHTHKRARAHAPHPQGVPIPSQSLGLGSTAGNWRLFWVRQRVANLVLDWVVACSPDQLSKPTPYLHPATSPSLGHLRDFILRNALG